MLILKKINNIFKYLVSPQIRWWVLSGAIILAGLILVFIVLNRVSYTVTSGIEQARLFYTDSKYAEAKITYEEVIDKYPRNVIAWNGLGNTLRDLGQYVQAEEAYLKAIKLAPSFEPVYRNLLTIYQTWPDESEKTERVENFKPIIENAVKHNQDSINILDAARTYYLYVGDQENADVIMALIEKIDIKTMDLSYVGKLV